MTNTNKHGFDAYGPRADGKGLLLNNETLKNNPLAIEEWKGAPCPDTQELEQLRQELEEAKECELEQRKAVNIYREVTLKYKQERDELSAYVERLRDIQEDKGNDEIDRDCATWDALQQIPTQSLQQHDNDVIERCAKECDEIAVYGIAKDCADDIRALKTGEGDE